MSHLAIICYSGTDLSQSVYRDIIVILCSYFPFILLHLYFYFFPINTNNSLTSFYMLTFIVNTRSSVNVINFVKISVSVQLKHRSVRVIFRVFDKDRQNLVHSIFLMQCLIAISILTISSDRTMLCVAYMPTFLSKLALMGAHEEDSLLLQTLTRRVVLHQVSTTALVSK